jgi:hypothetical protein
LLFLSTVLVKDRRLGRLGRGRRGFEISEIVNILVFVLRKYGRLRDKKGIYSNVSELVIDYINIPLLY